MPRANEVFRTSGKIMGQLPTKQYPYLKKLIGELDFACTTCTSGHGQPVYRTVEEVLQSGMGRPINGPGKFTTRWALLCPECLTVPDGGSWIANGIIDLLEVPKEYKRPKRDEAGTGGGLFEDDNEDADAPVLRIPEPSIAVAPKAPRKKASDQHPKSRGIKAKGNTFARIKKDLKKGSRKGEDMMVGA